MTDELRLWLFGGFRAEVRGQPVPDVAWMRSSARDLVKVLALEPGYRKHREGIVDAIWPDLDQASGISRLNKAMHFARRALGPDHLTLHGEIVALQGDPVWVDVDAFDDLLRGGDNVGALALYVGDLLPENRFDEWAAGRRSLLRAAMVRLLLAECAAQEAHGDSLSAIRSLERLVSIDPLHEEGHARLMRLNTAAGDRAAALRWYAHLVEVLRDELGVDPGESVRRLHGDIAAGRMALPAPVNAPPGPSRIGSPATGEAASEERKLVTVLAVDFSAAQHVDSDPERSRLADRTLSEDIGSLVRHWGGVVERQAGGAVIAFFGIPVAQEDHAARALSAALEVVGRLSNVRVGVDSGHVIAPTGADPALADVGGGVVDSAARLRDLTEAGTVLVGERTRRAASTMNFRFGVASLHRDARGHTTAFPLITSDEPAPRFASDDTPMFGRDDELQALLRLLEEAVSSGRPRLLAVVGAAGIGKSRLTREVVRQVVRRLPEAHVLRGRCLAVGNGITYWALSEILREACGFSLGDSSEVALQKLTNTLRTTLATPGIDDEERESTIHALAASAAIRFPDNPLDSLAPIIVAEAVERAWPRFLTACATRGPVLVVIEDLHWAGTAMLELIARLMTRSKGPVVLLVSGRPDFVDRHPMFRGSESASLIALRGLTDEASAQVLDNLAGAAGLAAAMRAEILSRAAGNPFFLEQLVAHVAEGGGGSLPDTLHALVAARIDSLTPLDKRVVQVASVVGRTFWLEPVQRLAGEDDIRVSIAELENRDLVLVRQHSSLAGQLEYTFKHALLRDVAYASLPAARRAHAHADIGAWFEETARDRAGEVMELIAHHYAAAVDSDDADVAWTDAPERREWLRGKAFAALIAAGVSARRRYAIAKALELHTRALGIAAGAVEQAAAHEEIADDHDVAYHGDAAFDAWEKSLALLRQESGHDDRRAAILLKAGRMVVLRWGGFPVPADAALGDHAIDEALTIATDVATRAQLLALSALCGARWAWEGKRDPAQPGARREAAEMAQLLAEECGSVPLQGLAILGVASADFIERRYDEGVRSILDHAVLMDRGSDERDRSLAHVIASIGIAHVSGRYSDALEHALVSYELARNLSAHEVMHGTCEVLSGLVRLGRWNEIAPFLDHHLAVYRDREREMGCPYVRSGPLFAALALAYQGDDDGARSLAARIPPNVEHPGMAEAVHAQIALELGDAARARALIEPLVRVGRRPGPEEIPLESVILVEILKAQTDWTALRTYLPIARKNSGFLAQMTPGCDRAEGLMLAAEGVQDRATRLLSRAVDGFLSLGLPLEVARTREQLARVRGGARLFASALDSYERLGAKRDLEHARASPLTR